MIYQIFLATLMLTSLCQQPPQQPVIGIYTQDIEDFSIIVQTKQFQTDRQKQENIKESMQTYIAASYVKNIQMGGAQVIPLFYHYSFDQLEVLLGKINGVFFPGGGAMNMTTDVNWVSKAKFIVNYAIKQNQAGNPYPIWGTCLGYYLVMYVLSQQSDLMKVLTRVTGENGILHSLIVKNRQSLLLKNFNQQQFYDATNNDGIFYFYHNWSIMLSTFSNFPSWVNLFNVVATSKTSYGAQFMSILQGKKYPFFLTQFHAQKNAFEWQIPAKRSYNAISSQQKLINTFISYARKNKNEFSSDAQLKNLLIYNYQPILIQPGGYFTQVYLFDQSKIKDGSQDKLG